MRDDDGGDNAELLEAEKPAENGMLALVAKAEIDMQIATAKKYPRDIKRFMSESRTLASLNEDIAGDCYYRLERKDKNGKVNIIEGPSSRLAEIVASTWGNCRAGARVIEESEDFITAQGAFIDLERNVAITYEVRRSIKGKYGRYSTDMIGVTANAACSIALRNAVFKGVPKAFWSDAYDEAVKTYRGDQKSLGERRQAMFGYFKKLGVNEEKVLAKIGRPSVAAVDLDDLVRLKGYATAIKEGDMSLDETFNPPPGSVPQARTAESISGMIAHATGDKVPQSATDDRPETAMDDLPQERGRDAGRTTTVTTATDTDESPVAGYLRRITSAGIIGDVKAVRDQATADETLLDMERLQINTATTERIEAIRSKRGDRNNGV